MNENQLLDAVDALTKSTFEHHPQKTDAGTYIKTHTAEHLPLLAQLRDAVNPSTNTAAGSSSLKSTRNLIDSDALYRYSLICAAIRDWCIILGQERTRDPIVDLRQWYIAYTRDTRNEGIWHLAELRKWAALIRNLIEPAKRLELITPCPVCKSDQWTDHEGQTLRHPIIIEYRQPTDGTAIKPHATCRNETCGAVWENLDALKELGEELEERHAG
jgi:hypothetical protein